MYIGKECLSDGLFKMNVMNVEPHVAMNENDTSFAYIVESSYIWHGRLGHVKYGLLKKLVNMFVCLNLNWILITNVKYV